MSLPTFTYNKTFGGKFPWGETVSWREGETPVYWSEGVIQLGRSILSEGEVTYFILTTQRAILIILREGESRTASEVDLEDVILVNSSGLRTVRLLGKNRDAIELVWTEGSDVNYAEKLINDMIFRRRSEISASLEADLRPSSDYQSMGRLLERSGLIVNRLRCFSCESEIEVPQSGNVAECQFCGNKQYTREIVARLKDTFS